jgi:hypothetical protein
MANSGAAGTQTRRLLRTVARQSLLFCIISVLAIAVTFWLARGFWQVTLLAVFGALLQTAILGLLYEVFLRAEVEEAAYSRLRIKEDVYAHGLIGFSADAQIGWQDLLDGKRSLSVVTDDPARLFGPADDYIYHQARLGYPKDIRIYIPHHAWEQCATWLTAYVDRWKSGQLPKSSIFVARISGSFPYELVAADDETIAILPVMDTRIDVGSAKMMHFRKSDKNGIGEWFTQQAIEMQKKLVPELGYVPPRMKNPLKPTQSAATTDEPEEVA